MTHTRSVLSLIGPRPSTQALGPSDRFVVAITAFLWALTGIGIWGAVVGLASQHALRDAVVAPVIVLGAAATSLPLTLFLMRMIFGGARVVEVLVAYAGAIFAGATALVLVAPLVALYQHSSTLVATTAGPASAIFGFAIAMFVFVRTYSSLTAEQPDRRLGILGVVVVIVIQALSMAQIASVTPPLFEHRTTFGAGVDALEGRSAP